MQTQNSRYRNTKRFQDTENNIFPGRRPRSISRQPGVLEHTLSAGDRLDLLALDYYNDVSKWWLILDANPEMKCAAHIDLGQYAGQTIAIPYEPEGAP